MRNSMQIIPSILVDSEKEFIREISSIQTELEQVQLDIADGKFVPQTTWADPEIVEKYTDIDMELHLMVAEPLAELQRWTATEVVKRVLIHYESVDNFGEIITNLKNYPWEIGVVLNPDTDIEVINDYLPDLDSVMFMGVQPGQQGQSLLSEVLGSIKKFGSQNPTMFTELDGGVNEQTLPDVIASGVKAICPGSAIFKNEREPKKNLEEMKKIINSLT